MTGTWHPSPSLDPILTTAGILQDSGSQAKTVVTSGKKKHRRKWQEELTVPGGTKPHYSFLIPFSFWQSLASSGDTRTYSPLALMGSIRNRAVPCALLLTPSQSASPSEPGRPPHVLICLSVIHTGSITRKHAASLQIEQQLSHQRSR